MRLAATITIAILSLVSLLWPLVGYAESDSVAVLRSFPVAWVDRDEPHEARDARLRNVANAVTEFTTRDRAGVLAIGFGESRWAEYVLHDCAYRPQGSSGNCDGGAARSYWQLHKSACPALWSVPSGSVEAVSVAAKCARDHWARALRTCGGKLESAFARYGGRGCNNVRSDDQIKARWARRLGL